MATYYYPEKGHSFRNFILLILSVVIVLFSISFIFTGQEISPQKKDLDYWGSVRQVEIENLYLSVNPSKPFGGIKGRDFSFFFDLEINPNFGHGEEKHPEDYKETKEGVRSIMVFISENVKGRYAEVLVTKSGYFLIRIVQDMGKEGIFEITLFSPNSQNLNKIEWYLISNGYRLFQDLWK